FIFFFSSRRRHTRSKRDWSSDVCSSDLSDLVMSLAEQSGQSPAMPDGDVSPCRRQPVLTSPEKREFAGSHIPAGHLPVETFDIGGGQREDLGGQRDRKSTRLNSSHVSIS